MNIQVMPREELAKFLNNDSKVPHLIISIWSYDEKPDLKINHNNDCRVLLTQFDDTEGESGISKSQARDIWKFIMDNNDFSNNIIVSCGAGISRSPGIAAGLLLAITGSDMQIFENTKYRPNTRCYRAIVDTAPNIF